MLPTATAILFAGAEFGRTALIGVNMALSAGSALWAALITHFRFGRPDASLCANGWVSGLAASSAACAFVVPAAAVVIGSTAGAPAVFAIDWLELRLAVDDPGGAISVHAVGGIWGITAVELFGHVPPGQWLAQAAGIATLLGFVLPLTYGLI